MLQNSRMISSTWHLFSTSGLTTSSPQALPSTIAFFALWYSSCVKAPSFMPRLFNIVEISSSSFTMSGGFPSKVWKWLYQFLILSYCVLPFSCLFLVILLPHSSFMSYQLTLWLLFLLATSTSDNLMLSSSSFKDL